MKNTKRILAFILLAFFAVSLVACGGTEKTLTVSIEDIQKAISQHSSEGELLAIDEDRLLDEIGIKSTDYKAGFFVMALGSVSVERVAFFECEDKASADALKTKLESHAEDIKNREENYILDNYEMASNAIIETEGKYVYLVMSPKKDDLSTIITAAFK